VKSASKQESTEAVRLAAGRRAGQEDLKKKKEQAGALSFFAVCAGLL
jgi:hypothetical protein